MKNSRGVSAIASVIIRMPHGFMIAIIASQIAALPMTFRPTSHKSTAVKVWQIALSSQPPVKGGYVPPVMLLKITCKIPVKGTRLKVLGISNENNCPASVTKQ